MASIITPLGEFVKRKIRIISSVIDPEEKARPNRNWARFIQKIAAFPGHDPGKWPP
jgi:hypothetical protein